MSSYIPEDQEVCCGLCIAVFLNRRAAARYWAVARWHQLYRASRGSPGIDN